MGGRERASRRATLRRFAASAATVGLAGCLGSDGAGTDGAGGTTRSTTTRATTTDGSATTTGETSGTTGEASGTPTTADDRGDYTVGCYTDLYFDPVGLHVQPGETVSFELVSGAHSATAYHPDNTGARRRRIPEGAPPWDTGVWSEAGTVRNVTFETPGTHDYYCIPHKAVGMVGRVVVGEPGGPAEASPNPDYDLPPSERIVSRGSIPYDDWAGSED